MTTESKCKITPNFTLDEFTASSWAIENGVKNSPSLEQIQNIEYLARKIAQPIRDIFGPTIIKSGFRTPQVNRGVGGDRNSFHLEGLAMDFICSRSSMRSVFEWLVISDLPYHTCIDQIQQKGTIHIDIMRPRQRLLFLNAAGQYVEHPFAKR